MGLMKDTVCTDTAYAKQQELIDDGCKCLIHHPTDPEVLDGLRDVMVAGDAFQAGLAMAQLGPCPGRGE